MNETQLFYFVTIVETGSFTEASLTLDIGQSSVSKQIQALEYELGVPLFIRGKKTRLSEFGELLLPCAYNILQEAKHMKELIATHNVIKINIITLPIFAFFNIHKLIYDFSMSNPNCKLSFSEQEDYTLIQNIRKGNYDIALSYWDDSTLMNQEDNTTFISKDEIVLAVNYDNPLSSLDFIPPKKIIHHSIDTYA